VIRALLVSAALTVLTSPLGAQAVSVLVGAVRAEYADSVSGTAGFLSGRVSAASPAAAAAVEASFSEFVTGEWALQLGGFGTALHTVSERLAVGIAGGGDASNFEGGTWSGSGGVGPILVTVLGQMVTSLAGSFGGVRRVDETAFAVGTGNLRLRGFPTVGLGIEGGLSGVVADAFQYLDATVGLILRGSRLEAGVSGGERAGDFRDGAWGSARVVYAITPWTIVEAALGRYPRDITGFTEGLFGSVGVRFNLSRTARARWVSEPVDAVRVERVNDERVRVTIRHSVRQGDRLEIAGDWNEWLPEALRQEGADRWAIDLRLTPGVYKFALLVNGEGWTVPEGVPTVPDDFGGEVGLLVIR
jgi:hypothetical protein